MKPKTATTRRRFFCEAGAVLSTPLAVAAASDGTAEDAEALQKRLRLLEDVNAIRELHQHYARLVGVPAHDEIVSLFADPANAPLDSDLRSVAADHSERDVIDVSADHRMATARFPCTVQIEAPIEPTCPLVEMAREQGGGVVTRTESGVFENVYVKRNGAWKIERVAYRRT
jgi:hypothetical protein